MRIFTLLSIALLFTAPQVFSQDFNTPPSYDFKTKEDYAKYETEVFLASKWLLATPFNEQVEKRKEVFRFIFAWVSGASNVDVEINPTVMDFEKKNPGMLPVYMAASLKYVMENNYSKDIQAKHTYAMHEMIRVYNAGKGIKKDKKMEKLIKADEEGKMDEWMAENMKFEEKH
jgi:hypothetical protein